MVKKNLAFEVESSSLVLLALATVMFARVITAIGVPAVFNFLHFAFFAIIFLLILPKVRHNVSIELLVGILALLTVMTLSAFVNSAGVINVVMDFLLLAEPFLVLLAIVVTHWSRLNLKRFRFWLFIFALIHTIFSFYQGLILRVIPDDLKGVFIHQMNGHHVGRAVALSAAVYFFVDFPTRSTWQRIAFTAASTAVVILSDAKQVIIVFLATLLLMSVLKLKDIRKFLLYLVIVVTTVGFLFWSANTIFPALKSWTNLDQNIRGLELKFSVFQIITAHYNSPLNWLLGLGPGHTVGRLGWLLPEYSKYLEPLGATMSPVTEIVWDISQKPGSITNASTGSSMWSLLFSWAGVWGDLGLLGLGAYMYLWFIVWWRFCLDDLSKFLHLNPIIFGCIFAWIEEPGYMLFLASLIGLRWQEYRSEAGSDIINSIREFELPEAL